MDKKLLEKIKKEVESEIFPSEEEQDESAEKQIEWILNKGRESGHEDLGAFLAMVRDNIDLVMPGMAGVNKASSYAKKLEPIMREDKIEMFRKLLKKPDFVKKYLKQNEGEAGKKISDILEEDMERYIKD